MIKGNFRQQSNNGQPYSYKNFLDLANSILSSNANFAPFEVARGTLDFFARAFQYNMDLPLFQVRCDTSIYFQKKWCVSKKSGGAHLLSSDAHWWMKHKTAFDFRRSCRRYFSIPIIHLVGIRPRAGITSEDEECSVHEFEAFELQHSSVLYFALCLPIQGRRLCQSISRTLPIDAASVQSIYQRHRLLQSVSSWKLYCSRSDGV